ncbi:hypothetical protein SLA2020_082770 [Shorea laevis]
MSYEPTIPYPEQEHRTMPICPSNFISLLAGSVRGFLDRTESHSPFSQQGKYSVGNLGFRILKMYGNRCSVKWAFSSPTAAS